MATAVPPKTQSCRLVRSWKSSVTFHLPHPDRDHTLQSLLAERLSASTLERIAQQLISLITFRTTVARFPDDLLSFLRTCDNNT
jgi:hypothetical protein